MLGYRIINEESLKKQRSFCPHCKYNLSPIDLVPIFSWLTLKGKCRYCRKPISILYPIIELLTATLFTILFLVSKYKFGYFIYFSALILTIRTDLEKMLISRIFTLYLAPIGILLSLFRLVPINFYQSVFGALIGFFSLLIVNKIFYALTKKQGIGEGDFDLLALIGAFTGPLGVLYSIFYGSILGSIIGISLILLNKKDMQSKLPFGPFLAIGSIIYTFLS